MTMRSARRLPVLGLHRQRGIALIMVLWLSILLAVLVASFSIAARIETLQARNLLDSVRARYAAEAGLHLAVYQLRMPDPLQRWAGDGRSYQFDLEGTQIDIQVIDESGKVDINAADLPTLLSLFQQAGREQADAEILTSRVMDWRDADELVTEPGGAEKDDYEAVDLAYGPRNQPFQTVDEVQQVLGMDYDTYLELEPLVTIYSGRTEPNWALAPPEVLHAFLQADPAAIDQFIELRETSPPGTPLVLPDGRPALAQGGGLTYTVRSLATLPSGASATLEATIRLGTGSIGARPFRIVRWRDNPES
ncbi:MAG: general secretion pathway protein GspK [Xanthomonadales bacterium]|nr:general secretion pathway protein GspK [Xanthomonadales bacterium]